MGCDDGIGVIWEGKFLSLILQKQGDTGCFSAKGPIRIRMKGQGSMDAEASTNCG